MFDDRMSELTSRTDSFSREDGTLLSFTESVWLEQDLPFPGKLGNLRRGRNKADFLSLFSGRLFLFLSKARLSLPARECLSSAGERVETGYPHKTTELPPFLRFLPLSQFEDGDL